MREDFQSPNMIINGKFIYRDVLLIRYGMVWYGMVWYGMVNFLYVTAINNTWHADKLLMMACADVMDSKAGTSRFPLAYGGRRSLCLA